MYMHTQSVTCSWLHPDTTRIIPSLSLSMCLWKPSKWLNRHVRLCLRAVGVGTVRPRVTPELCNKKASLVVWAVEDRAMWASWFERTGKPDKSHFTGQRLIRQTKCELPLQTSSQPSTLAHFLGKNNNTCHRHYLEWTKSVAESFQNIWCYSFFCHQPHKNKDLLHKGAFR